MEALLFDIGNVIMHFDFTDAGAKFAESSSVDTDPLEVIEPLKQELESGKIAGPEFVDRASKAIGFEGTAEDFTKIWEEVFSPNTPMWETIKGLNGKYPLYLLSNTSDIHKDYLFRDFDIFENFAAGIYSYSARSEKPEPEIYDITIKELGVDPKSTLYIDDLEPNIVAGRLAGFVSHHYHPSRHEDFLADAKSLGVEL